MDNHVLSIALATVSLVTGVALLANWVANRHIPGLLKISVGFFATCVGLLLMAMQGNDPLGTPVFIGSILIMGGRIPVLAGLASFWNQETSKLPLICSIWLLGTVAALFYFTFIDESMLWRTRVFTVMLVIFSASAAYILIRGLIIERKLRPILAINTTIGAYLLLTQALFNSVTEFLLLFFRGNQPILASGEATTAVLLGAVVSLTIFSIGVILMTMEELKVEYQENAIYDPITTILNQRTFIEVSNRVLGVALRYTKPVSMLTIELENLDEIVKEHGNKVGNKMLRHFALVATDRRRNEDVLARSSYKQFRMLLPGVDEAGAQVVVKKIEDTAQGEEYVYRGKSLKAEFVISAITKR